MSRTEKAQTNTEAQNTRWWESYLVRYFLGFIVGIVAIFVLALEFGIFEKTASWLTTAGFAAGNKFELATFVAPIALLGLGFCYLVSTPITVLHAGRYRRGFFDAHTRYFWFGWAMALLASPLLANILLPNRGLTLVGLLFFIAYGMWLYLAWSSDTPSEVPDRKGSIDELNYEVPRPLGYGILVSTLIMAGITVGMAAFTFFFDRPTAKSTYLLLVFGTPVLWIGFVQYAVLYRLLSDQGLSERFYAHLFDARRQTNAKDVRDTYTHLREHSNSIFIVLLELCVVAFIIGAARLSNSSTLGHQDFSVSVLAGVGVWVLPTVFMWSRANAMERFFAKNPDIFLKKIVMCKVTQQKNTRVSERCKTTTRS